MLKLNKTTYTSFEVLDLFKKFVGQYSFPDTSATDFLEGQGVISKSISEYNETDILELSQHVMEAIAQDEIINSLYTALMEIDIYYPRKYNRNADGGVDIIYSEEYRTSFNNIVREIEKRRHEIISFHKLYHS